VLTGFAANLLYIVNTRPYLVASTLDNAIINTGRKDWVNAPVFLLQVIGCCKITTLLKCHCIGDRHLVIASIKIGAADSKHLLQLAVLIDKKIMLHI